MAYKMQRISDNLSAGLNAQGNVVLNHLFWRDDDGALIDALMTQDDCRALGEFVSSGRIQNTRKEPLDEWDCPIKLSGCKENCGSYGCGN